MAKKRTKPKVYLETTVISYLTAWPSRDLVIAAHQQITRDWWEQHRSRYDLFVSEMVLGEAGAGDPVAAKERLDVLEDVPELTLDDAARELAVRFLSDVPLPANATVDAFHIAIAVVNGIDYLLTWNCRHIANAALRTRINAVCTSAGYPPPIICTPEELLGGEA